MSIWSHYTFKQRILWKASQTTWCQVHIVTEDYTSKTCGNCGFIKDNLGRAKIYKCEKCKMVMDRDVNGARNIYLKNLSHCG